MADMSATDLPLLPVDIDEALQRTLDEWPLPSGVADADMNQDELAGALGQSVNTIAKWIKSGMPVARHGRNGLPYVLRLSHCYAWMRNRDAETERRAAHNRAQSTALQAELLGLKLDTPAAQITPKQRREMAEAEIVWHKAQRERRELVQIGEVRDLLEAVLSIVRDGIEAMPDRLERELNLKPEQVSATIRLGRDILDGIAERIQSDCLGDVAASDAIDEALSMV